MRRPIKKKNKPTKDTKYGSYNVQKMINYVMLDGKKTVATKIVYDAFDIIKEKDKADPLKTFEVAIQNVAPTTEVRSRRIGGANYQIPREVSEQRKLALALRWIIQSAKDKKGSPMSNKLAKELILASKEEGDAFNKKQNTHKMAEANRAFAHLSW